MRMNGTRVLVTGAASGIGKAVVSKLCDEGAEVVAADISYPDLMSARDGFSESHLDVTDPTDWERLMKRAGSLNALVASAGLSDARPIDDTGLDDWRKVMAVNLDGAFLSVKYGARAMHDCQSGSIVLIGSASGVKAVPQAAAYCSSKAGMRMLAKAAALELKAQGIRVNCVSPAGVVTPMWKKMPFWSGLVEQHGSEEAAWGALGGADPNRPSIQRMAFPEEIAEAVVFFCCSQSAHITGADLAVDGGYSAS
jgi:2-keto-3-deoxy-L-fuconate dehydrogenase